MRLRHHSGRIVHVSSGLDVRPARDLPTVVGQLDTYAAAVRARLGVDTVGVSLWLPPTLAAALAADGRARTRLRDELDARGLEIVTLSGVPYAGGGGEDDRYEPDWSEPARLEYTLDLARILVDLLPDDCVRGAVTTVGIGRRHGWDDGKERAFARVMGRLSAGLAEVAWHTGRAVRVGFQPEPGCVLDATDQTVAALGRADRDRIGVCLDLAQLACTWEDPAAALDGLAAAGISVIRAQIGAAVEVADPAAAAGHLRGYGGAVTNPAGAYVEDVAAALDQRPPGPWRVAHHVPLTGALPDGLAPTTDVWRTALRGLVGGPQPATEYLDIHPTGDAPGEFAYVRGELAGLGLSPPAEARAA